MFYFTLDKDNQGQWYWLFIAGNAVPNPKVIARSSESYHNRQDCLHSIALVQKWAASAKVYDQVHKGWI